MVAAGSGSIPHGGSQYVPVERASGEQADRYTGVVLIHGIGDEKRNETLQEALNALTYWFTQIAGLALRPSGAGRVWVHTDLTNDDDPDSPSSRATLELEAPSHVAAQFAAVGGNRPLRLEIREVWWAQSFGLPPVGTSLAWATRQLWEELHILWPRIGHSGLASAAQRAPARETPQAVTYRPVAQTGGAETVHNEMTRWGKRWREGILWLYDGAQAMWKALEILALAPLVLLLLMLVWLVRLLAVVPFLQSAVIGGLANLVNYVSLHWIGPLRVYLLDYTRSASMRQLFEREVSDLLRDEYCERIIVIAHSMGTVIAYEGLATSLMTSEGSMSKKPITFICLAQALGRLWALKGVDPHRLRYALPDRLRWLHFWARYDPVSVGPLTARILPRLTHWTDTEVQDPHEELCRQLDQCENVDVVNRDSIFTDHVTYWQNMEQVVGPIARELVAGYPAMEHVAHEYQATQGEVLRRRLQVAGRSMATLVSGLTIGILLLTLDLIYQWHIGAELDQLGVIHALLNVLASVSGAKSILDGLHLSAPQWMGDFMRWLGIKEAVISATDKVLTLTADLLVMLITFAVIGKVVAEPSPYESLLVARSRSNGTRLVFYLSFGFIPFLVIFVGFVIFASVRLTNKSADESLASLLNLVFVLLLGIGCLWLLGIWLAALVASRRRRQWGWFGVALIAPFVQIAPLFLRQGAFEASLPLFETAVFDILIFMWGAWAIAIDRWRQGRILRGLGLLLAFGAAQMTSFVLPLAPAILYGIWVGPAITRREPAEKAVAERSNRRRIHIVATLALVILFGDYTIVAVGGNYLDPAAGWGLSALVLLGSALSVFAWIWGLQDILAGRRWAWLIGYLVGTGLTFGLAYLVMSPFLFTSRGGASCDANTSQCYTFTGLLPLIVYGLWPALLSGVLVYCLWDGPTKRRATSKGLLMQLPTTVGGALALAAPQSRPVWQPSMPGQPQYPPAQQMPPGTPYPPYPQSPYGPTARPGYMPPQPMPPAAPGYGQGMLPQHSMLAPEQGREMNRPGYMAPGAVRPGMEGLTQPHPGGAPPSLPPTPEEPPGPPTSMQEPPRA